MKTFSDKVILTIISHLCTAVLSLLAGIALYHYTNKKPELVYEKFPPSHHVSDSEKISIYHARIKNIGHKEVENLTIYLQLNKKSEIANLDVSPSLQNIKYSVKQPEQTNSREIAVDLLNPDETLTFSILAENTSGDDLYIEARAKGVIAYERTSEPRWKINIITGAMSGVTIVTLYILLHVLIQKITEILSMLKTNNSIASKQIQLMRTKNTLNKDDDIRNLLTSCPFRLFFNPAVPGLSKSKTIAFSETGEITEGRNKNEYSWSIKNGMLEIKNVKGQLHSRFYYSPQEEKFFHTNDPDTLAIKDQYIVKESHTS